MQVGQNTGLIEGLTGLASETDESVLVNIYQLVILNLTAGLS